MSARVTMPDGSIRQWHSDLTECDRADCDRRHLTGEELFRSDPEDDRAFYFAAGKEHRP